LAPTGSCLFGNDILVRSSTGLNMPKEIMTCDEFFQSVISQNQSPKTYCQMSVVSTACCKTCPSNYTNNNKNNNNKNIII
jgi:hypothetical protein